MRSRAWQLTVAATLVLCLGGCSEIGAFDRAPSVQEQHTAGVPHVTDEGTVSLVPNRNRGRVQRILYHALAGRIHDRSYELETVRQAGFTAVHPWEGQDLETFLAAAKDAGLGVVPHYPGDEIAAQADRHGILAWYLDEEPTLRFPEKRQDALRAHFRQRRAELKTIDPLRPVFALLGPPLDRVRPQWDKWAREGDLSVHDNYAVHERISTFTNPVRHVARSVSFARSLVPENRPLWFVIQAFSSEDRGWTMPTASEYRGMAMAALIHGASGIVTFAFDSFVTRDDHVLGIAPAPLADYGAGLPDYNGDGKAHRVAQDMELAQSVTLWNEISDFNHYLEQLGPLPLLPNRPDQLSVFAPARDGLSNPVRVALKRDGDIWHVFAVNLLAAAVDTEFRLQDSTAALLESNYPYGPQRRHAIVDGVWRDTIEPLGVRVYRISDE